MRRLLATLAAVAAVTVTGCSSDDTAPAAPPSTPPGTSHTVSAAEGRKQFFLTTVNADVHGSYTNAQLLTFAHNMCADLDRGESVRHLAVREIASGVDPSDLADILTSAVWSFCPEHKKQMRNL